MPVTVNTLNNQNFRHSVHINKHELFTDLPNSLGGDDSAPSPRLLRRRPCFVQGLDPQALRTERYPADWSHR